MYQLSSKKKYGKAVVETYSNGMVRLVSYGTIVAEFNQLSRRYWQNDSNIYSQTTAGHVRKFKDEYDTYHMFQASMPTATKFAEYDDYKHYFMTADFYWRYADDMQALDKLIRDSLMSEPSGRFYVKKQIAALKSKLLEAGFSSKIESEHRIEPIEILRSKSSDLKVELVEKYIRIAWREDGVVLHRFDLDKLTKTLLALADNIANLESDYKTALSIRDKTLELVGSLIVHWLPGLNFHQERHCNGVLVYLDSVKKALIGAFIPMDASAANIKRVCEELKAKI